MRELQVIFFFFWKNHGLKKKLVVCTGIRDLLVASGLGWWSPLSTPRRISVGNPGGRGGGGEGEGGGALRCGNSGDVAPAHHPLPFSVRSIPELPADIWPKREVKFFLSLLFFHLHPRLLVLIHLRLT